MSAISTPHILSLNWEYTFLLSNFLIIGLWSSLVNIEELLKPLPLDFLSKKF